MTSPWTVHNDKAELSAGQFNAVVDLRQPALGIEQVHAFGTSLPEVRLFGLHHDLANPQPIAGPIVEQFVRHDDLFVRFAQSHAQPFSPSVYWSYMREAADIVGLRLIASIQTDLLDTHPDLITRTACPVEDLRQLASEREPRWQSLDVDEVVFDETSTPYCVLIRLPNAPVSYAEMIHPADLRSVALSVSRENGAATVQIDSLLLTRWMEKGVILRARAQGLFVARDNDEQTIFAAYQRFVDAALPLTV